MCALTSPAPGAIDHLLRESQERLQLLIDKGYHPLAYRLMCLQAHYRSELEFSWEGLQAALVRLKRMVMAHGNSHGRLPAGPIPGDCWEYESVTRALVARFDAAISADLNTAFQEIAKQVGELRVVQ